ncbi:hypothetical protein ACB098_06G224700 [Castanea mollissima]
MVTFKTARAGGGELERVFKELRVWTKWAKAERVDRRGSTWVSADRWWVFAGGSVTLKTARVVGALSLSSIDVSLATRHLLDTPAALPSVLTLPTVPSLPKATLLPLPSVPTLPKATLPPLPSTPLPTLPTQPTLPKPTLPPLPTNPLPTLPNPPTLPKSTLPSTQVLTLPTMPTVPMVTLPPLPGNPLPTIPTTIPSIPTTIPTIPFLSPPPSK